MKFENSQRELEVREDAGLQRLVAEERERDEEEDREPDDPRREQQVGRRRPDAGGRTIPRARARLGLLAEDRCHFVMCVSLFERRGVVLVQLRESVSSSGKISVFAASFGSIFASSSFAPLTGVT